MGGAEAAAVQLQRSPGSPSRSAGEAEALLRRALAERSGERATDPTVRRMVEARLGPLGEVRVHVGSQAAAVAEAFGAEALTVGRDIFFGAGRYAPDTAGGAELLAHELTHVAQSRGRSVTAGDALEVDPAHSAAEQHAHSVAADVARVHGSLGSAALATEQPWARLQADFASTGGAWAAPTAASAAVQLTREDRVTRNIDSVRVGEGRQQDPNEEQQRRDTVNGFRQWLESRVTEINSERQAGTLAGTALVERIEGVLWQTEDLAARLRNEAVIDIATLPTQPAVGQRQDAGGIPPEWIQPARQLIEVLERVEPTAENGAAAPATNPEGNRVNGNDWNTRLGVPQYRTQSDNLASPEATCNVTSFAMVAERLGMGRGEVLAAIEQRLQIREDATPAQRAETWQRRVLTFLQGEMRRGQAYQRLRGQAAVDARTLQDWATNFRDTAQMEDLVAFLAHLMGIERTALVGNATQVINALAEQRQGDNLPTFRQEEIFALQGRTWQAKWTWLSGRIQECLSAGGAAFYSFYHKGSGRDGTHITTVQRVTNEGLILDDPYGGVRAGYTRSQAGDAYAPAGQTGRTAAYKNQVDRTNAGDWQTARAQELEQGESRGNSHLFQAQGVVESLYYVRLVFRDRANNQQNRR
jgi:hypothetical protein